MTTEEVAEVLGVERDVVKTRLHRARNTLRQTVETHVGEAMGSVHTFGNERCSRVVAGVLERLCGRA